MLDAFGAMITKTTLTAIRALVFVGHNTKAGSLPPRRIAEALGESPSYMAKVTRALVKAGILRTGKGVKGGVWLGRPANEITLLGVFEACQGNIVGDYCQSDCDLDTICSFHRAASELYQAVMGVLSRWTLAHLLKKPEGTPRRRGIPCVMLGAGVSLPPASGLTVMR
jgi:Rrf2 family protein